MQSVLDSYSDLKLMTRGAIIVPYQPWSVSTGRNCASSESLMSPRDTATAVCPVVIPLHIVGEFDAIPTPIYKSRTGKLIVA